jgi:hypothetical protein
MKRLYFSYLLVLLAIVLGTCILNAQVNVLTWHNDNARTGQNTQETTLTQQLVANHSNFGKLCSATVDGMVHAQPLVANVAIGGHAYTAVFIVTRNDTVYVFDGVNVVAGQPCIKIAERHLPASGQSASGGGILGTPVIDLMSNTLYVVAQLQVSGVASHFLYALDITSKTLANKVAPVPIKSGSFSSTTQIQRPGMLGISSTPGTPFDSVYVGFARNGTFAPNHHGWIFSFDPATLTQRAAYCDTCETSNSNGGGIWQGAGGLAAGVDSNSGKTYLFFVTGDGDFDLSSGGQDAGDSFVKMTTDLSSVADFFTPFDQACRNCPEAGSEHDKDFGSGGVTLIPDNLLPNYPYIAVMADKEGFIWVVDRANLGGYNGKSTGSCPNLACTGTNRNLERLRGSTHEIHSNPAYWNSTLYYAAEGDVLKAFPLSNSSCASGKPPVCSSQVSTTAIFAFGAAPSVSSNGTSDGIIWAINGNGQEPSTPPGVLYAFNADTLSELYNSSACKIGGVNQDQPGPATKFSVPTIANGRVYIGTQTDFDIYGPLPQSRTCQ